MAGQARLSPFVGRRQELATLTTHLAAAAAGQGGLVLLAGEPGVGKSRLLATLAAQARADGWLVLSGHTYEAEGMPAYVPFIEALAMARHSSRAGRADGGIRSAAGQTPGRADATAYALRRALVDSE